MNTKVINKFIDEFEFKRDEEFQEMNGQEIFTRNEVIEMIEKFPSYQATQCSSMREALEKIINEFLSDDPKYYSSYKLQILRDAKAALSLPVSVQPAPQGVEELKMVEIEKPIGDFILAQKDIKPERGMDGNYYHYKDVCTLLNRIKSHSPSDQADIQCNSMRGVLESLVELKDYKCSSRWVKAIERLPKMEKVVFLKDSNGVMNIGNFYEQDQAYFVYFQRNGAHEEFEKPWHHHTDIYWLDESQSASCSCSAMREALEEADEYLSQTVYENGKPKQLNYIGAGSKLHQKFKSALSPVSVQPAPQGVEEAASQWALKNADETMATNSALNRGFKAGVKWRASNPISDQADIQ